MKKNLLIIDDEEVVTEIAKKKFELLGYNVMIANDGEEALVCLDLKKPDLIVLDVQMPKMNGYTFLHEMEKTKVPIGSIPIIVLTAYNTMEPIFKRHGVRAYLLKPLKLEELAEKIKEILG